MDDCERESVRKSHLGRQANKKKRPSPEAPPVFKPCAGGAGSRREKKKVEA